MDYSYSYSASADLGQVSPIFMIAYLALMVFFLFCGWKLFVKAGQPGWASIIPFYNIFVMLKIVGKPAWWFILFLIPIANFIVAILITNELSKRFGKGMGTTLGLIFLPYIFLPMLALGSAKYTAPVMPKM